MSSILSIVQQQHQTPIDEDKLRILCARKNVWDHFGLERKNFLSLSDVKQLQLVRKFYFENLSSASRTSIDSSIGTAIQNSSELSMTKIIESGNDRTEMTLSTVATEEKKHVEKSRFFLAPSPATSALKKLIFRKIPFPI